MDWGVLECATGDKTTEIEGHSEVIDHRTVTEPL